MKMDENNYQPLQEMDSSTKASEQLWRMMLTQQLQQLQQQQMNMLNLQQFQQQAHSQSHLHNQPFMMQSSTMPSLHVLPEQLLQQTPAAPALPTQPLLTYDSQEGSADFLPTPLLEQQKSQSTFVNHNNTQQVPLAFANNKILQSSSLNLPSALSLQHLHGLSTLTSNVTSVGTTNNAINANINRVESHYNNGNTTVSANNNCTTNGNAELTNFSIHSSLPAVSTSPNPVFAPLPAAENASSTLKSRTQQRTAQLNEREKFYLFVKLLLKCLDAGGDGRLRGRVKAIIAECTQGNRRGDPEYVPLQDALERRLRQSVGDLYWTRANLYFDQYRQRRGIPGQSRSFSVLPAPLRAAQHTTV